MITVVTPARNDVGVLAPTLGSLVGEDILLVGDRCADGMSGATPEAAASYALPQKVIADEFGGSRSPRLHCNRPRRTAGRISRTGSFP